MKFSAKPTSFFNSSAPIFHSLDIIGDTEKPSFAYFIAGANKLSNGKKPNFSESVIQLETAPGTVTLSQPRNGIFSKLLNLSEVQLAGDLPEALRPCSFSPSQITAKASEPKPQPVGSTTVRVIADAMAASIAFPPFAIICIPACAASG